MHIIGIVRWVEGGEGSEGYLGIGECSGEVCPCPIAAVAAAVAGVSEVTHGLAALMMDLMALHSGFIS